MWGRARMLCYVNQGDIPCTIFILMLSRYQSSKSNSAHGSRKHWNHSCVHVCWLSLCAYVCVCTVFWICVLTVNACLCVFLNVEFDIHEHFSLFLSKVQQILDHPKLQAPKIEPWSHSFHRSGPPSSSTPTPHTVSITWTLQITLWHKTRVCPLHD